MRAMYLAVIAALVAVATPSRAATVTETYNFTIGSFTCVPLSQQTNCPTPSLGPVSGSVAVTIDPTLYYTDDTTDITVNSFSGATVGSTLGFSYNPTPINAAGAKILFLGGIQNGAATAASGTNDIVVAINVASPAAPVLLNCADYSFCGFLTGNGNYLVSDEVVASYPSFDFRGLAAGSSITATSGSASGSSGTTSVPEPATLGCLVSALAGLGMVRRRGVITSA